MIEPEELYRLVHQQPFRPLRVYVHDGRTFDLHYSHLVMVLRNHVNIGIPMPNQADPFYDYMESVDLADIDRVEPLDAPAEPKTA
jgi:hypothetical protein